MHTTCKTIHLLFITVLLLAACAGSKRHYGNYYNKWRYWGAMYVLKADSSFDYTFRNNAGEVTITDTSSAATLITTYPAYVFSDSSYGRYTLRGDTVYFNYATDRVKGDFNGNNTRPARLLWQGKKLFYIAPNGEVIRQKEYYMQLQKGRAANLYRLDEQWGRPR